MAKLKAPLISLGASGAIGKALVFFGWKGIDCVREYVIPSNPQSTPQTTQRGYLTNAVTNVHLAEALAGHELSEADKTAYALYGSTEPTPRTWFNQAVARYIIAQVNSEIWQLLGDGTFTDPATTEITLVLWNYQQAAQAGRIYWGTSKTSMPNSQACNGAGSEHTAVMTGFTKGVKYYFQFRPTKETDDKYVCRSGIYHHVST